VRRIVNCGAALESIVGGWRGALKRRAPQHRVFRRFSLICVPIKRFSRMAAHAAARAIM
jgi:hypothetical protein